ncbi:hypothetical protein A9Q96_09625 [Rhodobacterales bacterium 52_120_T64]|nr:hypothetical protein A9Q96_09625 [Rhodobacterales bacterium 52_120_T64]
MFPSPQEREALNTMKRDLWSGVGPKQFGLEMQRSDEIVDYATSDRAHYELHRLKLALVFVRSLKSRVHTAVSAMSLAPEVR